MVDLGHKNAFDLLLKEAWNPEQAAMGNSTLPTACNKLNVMSAIQNRKLIAALTRELKERDLIIEKFEERIIKIENQKRGRRSIMADCTGWILDVSMNKIAP